MESHIIATGIETTIIGMGIVFFVLILLSVLIHFLVKLLNKDDDKSNNPEPKKEKPLPVSENKTVVNNTTGISPKTVAAIMAAVSAVSGRPMANLKFTSIKRKNCVNLKWAEAGKSEIINTKNLYI